MSNFKLIVVASCPLASLWLPLGFRPCSSAAETGAMAVPPSLFLAGLLNRSGLHSALDFIIASLSAGFRCRHVG
jgi:hypothetical protein